MHIQLGRRSNAMFDLLLPTEVMWKEAAGDGLSNLRMASLPGTKQGERAVLLQAEM